jgi:ElaB/YqjD/DUF883 family membrane-anchored ribosome-binding protein
MRENTNREVERNGALKKVLNTGVHFAEVGVDALLTKAKLSQTVEDGVYKAKRLAKRGRYAAEDLVDETAHRIKRDPLRSIAVTFGIAFGLGALTAWLATRMGERRG